MKKIIHKADSRGLAEHGWLTSYHTFSFADYYDPSRIRFGLLRVLNDDIVQPRQGFGTHPHDNMEIVTIPLLGELAHKDSMGTKHVIRTGDVQIMSAGTGITHSEFNNSDTDLVNLLQIWIFPKLRNIEPRYDQMTFNHEDRKNKIMNIISPEKSSNTLWINQDAYLSIANIDMDQCVTYDIKRKGNGLYIFVIEGEINAAAENLTKRDAMGLEDINNIDIIAGKDSDILLIEVPMSA